MKKLLISIIILITLFLIACNSTLKKPDMYIEKAELSEEEREIAKLLGANEEQAIYNFKLDDSVKSLRISVYKLGDKGWAPIIGRMGGESFTHDNGRLVLDFENLNEEVRISIVSEDNGSSSEYSIDDRKENRTQMTTFLDEIEEIIYEEEIPLAIQYLTDQDTTVAYGLEYFSTPEKYEKGDNIDIYAIAIMFSQKTVNELDTIGK